MESLHIRHLEKRYHLPESRPALRERLDGLLHRVLDEALEIALERVGISPADEICIRSIHVPLRLRLSDPDWELIARWSMALAEYIQTAVSSGAGAGVVRYRSRLAAVLDFAAAALRGDNRRVWAWHQLEIADLPEMATPSEMRAALLRFLVCEPALAMPVFGTLARQGLLPILVRQTPIEEWRELVSAVLRERGIADEYLSVDATAVPVREQRPTWTLAASAIARSLSGEPAMFGEAVLLRYLSLLILLEVEPLMLRRPPEQALQRLAEIERQLAEAACAESSSEAPVRSVHTRDGISATRLSDRAAPGTRQALFESAVEWDAVRAARDDFAARDEPLLSGRPADSGAPETAEKSPPEAVLQESTGLLEESQSALPADAIAERVTTRYGGLLYLLRLLDREGLADELLSAEPLADRPPGWVMRELALALLPLASDDPALMVFCGVLPGEEPPWRHLSEIDEAETALIENHARRTVDALAAQTGWERQSREWLMDKVCARHARIEAEPGWAEVIFDLTDVCTEIRRAALDLDPGYVPWLGMIIRFRYE